MESFIYSYFIWYFIFSFAQQCVCFSFAGFYNGLAYHTFSIFSEQCDSRWVTENIQGLSADLERKLFGQDLATDVILGALESHSKNKHKRKPLVLNFHGWTGGGKGYVADFIVTNWFREGRKSKFVKMYQAMKHFPLKDKAYEYQRQLQDDLESTIRKCSKSIFVFDEVDKYPPNVLDGIKPYLDYNTQVNGLDFREAIFIFITNCGDTLINQIVLEKFQNGIKREELVMRDFESHLKMLAFNHEGGFFQSDLIKHHLIDHVVPFLPLERKHVKLCIEAEVKLHGGNSADIADITREIMEDLEFKPDHIDIFSSSGCKQISEKVFNFIDRGQRKKRRRTEF